MSLDLRASRAHIEGVLEFFRHGGDMASTWAGKLKEHAGAYGLIKTCTIVIGNDYALAA